MTRRVRGTAMPDGLSPVAGLLCGVRRRMTTTTMRRRRARNQRPEEAKPLQEEEERRRRRRRRGRFICNRFIDKSKRHGELPVGWHQSQDCSAEW